MNSVRPTISAILITKNEAHNLGDCLAGLRWCDEVVVVDSGSTDGTLEIARAAGAKVTVFNDWPGFGPQKNRALDLATSDWIFSIDADERVDDTLAEEIRDAVLNASIVGYDIPRRSLFVGRYMRHGGWWPDRVLRLARRSHARFTEHRVHERLVVDGEVASLRSPLSHLSYRDFDSVLAKLNRYSTDGAHDLRARGKHASISSAIGHAFWAFIRTYIVKRGFLDGRYGFLLAVVNAQTSFWKYVKLSEPIRDI
ncbi:MAG TPA: glycosyltransferase family 2 protein [Burkholderiaceae bacterium]|nr:glycosyltransferase family 2 protein [Burkholderiaceae bacterium]